MVKFIKEAYEGQWDVIATYKTGQSFGKWPAGTETAGHHSTGYRKKDDAIDELNRLRDLGYKTYLFHLKPILNLELEAKDRSEEEEDMSGYDEYFDDYEDYFDDLYEEDEGYYES